MSYWWYPCICAFKVCNYRLKMASADWLYLSGQRVNQADTLAEDDAQATVTIQNGNDILGTGGATVMAVVRSTCQGAVVPLIGNLEDASSSLAGNSLCALRVLGALYSTSDAAPGQSVVTSTAYSDAIVRLPAFIDSRESVLAVLDAVNDAIVVAGAAYRDVLHPTGVVYPDLPWLVTAGVRMQVFLPVDSARLPGDGITAGYRTWISTPNVYPVAASASGSPRRATVAMGLLFNDALAALLSSFSLLPAEGAPTYSSTWIPSPPAGSTLAPPRLFLRVQQSMVRGG